MFSSATRSFAVLAASFRFQIHELHSPAMRDRHWKNLLDVTEQHRPPAERRMSRVRAHERPSCPINIRSVCG